MPFKTCLNVHYGTHLDRLLPILDDMCPIRTFRIKNYRPVWITPELIEQIKDRDCFYNKAKLGKDEDHWNIAKHLRYTTNANIRQAKRDFVLSELDDCSTDYKKTGKTIRTVIPDDKGDARRDIILKDNGVKLAKQEVASYINNYFINIGKVSGGGGRCPP